MCGRYPFYDTSSSKLEDLIKSGKLTYSEPEWKSISDKGTYMCVVSFVPCTVKLA